LKSLITNLVFLLLALPAFAQTRFTLNGKIQEARNGEAVIGATIAIKGTTTGTAANEYGFYSLTLPAGSYTFVVSAVGFAAQEFVFELKQNTVQNFQLAEETTTIQEVVVLAEGEEVDKNVISSEMSVTKIGIKELKKMPALLGEVDVIRNIQLTSGVSTVGEGAAGFSVRGGNIDQNLILLDEAPVYNSSHLLGFFSIFNADAVKDVKLLKGGIPAQFGGRLSSVLDVRMKDGNAKHFQASGGIGLISSRLTLEAPIVKDKISFIVAARRSYADLFLKASDDKQLSKNDLYFYDLSAKINYRINSKNTVFLSGYLGQDVFNLGSTFTSAYGNGTATLRWNHIFNNKLFANFTALYSNYNYSLGVPEGGFSFVWTSRLIDYSVKADFTYYFSPKSTLTFGGQGILRTQKPANVKPATDASSIASFGLENRKAGETAVYVSHDYQFSPKFSVQYGLRYSAYALFGTGTFYDYKGAVGQRLTPTNPKTYGNFEPVAEYQNLEPRLSFRYLLNDKSSIKASYNRTAQYLQLISNNAASTPADLWTLSTKNIKPATADQFALGYFRNFKNNMYEASAEVYYKNMNNLVDYINGAELLINKDLEAELLYGIGRAYGLELSMKKNTGKFTGWVSYTLSKTQQKTEGVNRNEWYNAKYDRTHNLSVVAMYKLSTRWSLSANFAYSTGIATTVPNSRFQLGDTPIVQHNTNEDRNNFRVPDYHRLDISATLESKKKRRWQGEWVFSIYNVYAQRNPFTIYFRQNDKNPQQNEAVRLSVLGSVLPSVTYNFKF
jgi:hypothetical protein